MPYINIKMSSRKERGYFHVHYLPGRVTRNFFIQYLLLYIHIIAFDIAVVNP